LTNLRPTRYLAAANLGVRLTPLGSPCNAVDSDTVRVIGEDADIGVWMYRGPGTSKTIIPRTPDVEWPIRSPDAASSVAQYDTPKLLRTLHLRPAGWE
jgi:hypothetical protein